MEQQLSEKSTRASADTGALETSLRAVWERARLMAELLSRLREENRILQERAGGLEEELQRVQQELRDAKEQIKDQPPVQAVQGKDGAPPFANGEREALMGKVKDLLTKLDAYL